MPKPTLPSPTRLHEAFGEPDRDLLARFTAGDEAAFAELVRRHGPMVLGVCDRALGNRDDAEDAYQTTFLELAKRAGRADWRESLSGWLHDVAWRTANKLRIRNVRQRDCELQAEAHAGHSGTDDLPEALDEEIRQLPITLRETVLCCYFQGLTRQQAADKLGVSARTLDRRLQEGKRRLRERLEARGEIIPVLLIGSTYSLTSYLGRWWLVAGLALITSTALAAWPHAPAPPAAPPVVEKAAPPGDPLPDRPVALRGQVKFSGGFTVSHLAFSPDGKLLATSGDGYGRCVGIWEFSTGKLLHVFSEKHGRAGSLAFSPDGKQIVAAVQWSARVWDVAKGKLVHELSGHTNGVEDVAWSDDGRWIASSSRDSTVRLWDAKAGKVAHVLKVENWRPEQVVFSPGSKLLGTVGRDSILRVWDPSTGKELHRLGAKGVGFLAFAPDGSQMVWGGEGVLYAWATEGKVPPRVLSKGDGFFQSPVFSPDGRTIATGITDGRIRLLDAKTGRETRRWRAGNHWIGALAYSPDGKTLVSGGQWTSVPRQWDPATGKEIEPAAGHTAWAERLCFPPGGKTLISLGGDNKVIRWDLATRAPNALTLPDRRRGHIHAFSPDGKRLAVGGLDPKHNVIKLVDVATGATIREIDGHKTFARTVAFANNGRWLATIDADAVIRIWDLQDGKPRLWIEERVGETRYGRIGNFPMLFSHDDRRLVNAGLDGVLRLYDTATGKLLHKYDLQCEAGGVAVAPDDKLIAVLGVANDNRVVLLWDPNTGKMARVWDTGQQSIHGIAFSPDGRLLATAGGGNENSVKLWDVATRQEVATFQGEQGATIPLAFSRDGRTLATGCTDSSLLLWDVTGRGVGVGKVLTTKKLHELWNTLADEDAKKVNAATWELALSAGGAVPFLRERVAPVKPADAAAIDRLVKQLGADEFAARQAATKALEKLGGAAVPRLRKALESGSDLEVRRRVEAVIATYYRGDDWQRQRHAVAVLERGGSAQARKFLDELAAGADGAPLTEEARAAARRGGVAP